MTLLFPGSCPRVCEKEKPIVACRLHRTAHSLAALSSNAGSIRLGCRTRCEGRELYDRLQGDSGAVFVRGVQDGGSSTG